MYNCAQEIGLHFQLLIQILNEQKQGVGINFCNCGKCGKLFYQMLISFSSPCFSVKVVFNYGAIVRLHHVHRYGEPQAEIMQSASHSMTVNLGGGGGVSNSHWI